MIPLVDDVAGVGAGASLAAGPVVATALAPLASSASGGSRSGDRGGGGRRRGGQGGRGRGRGGSRDAAGAAADGGLAGR